MEIIDLASSNEKDDTYEEFKLKLETEYIKVFYNHRRFNQTEKKVLIIKPF